MISSMPNSSISTNSELHSLPKISQHNAPSNLKKASDTPPSTVLKLSDSKSAQSTSDVYSPPSFKPPTKFVTVDFFSFGDTTDLGAPKGLSRLEYNAYRPDGININAKFWPPTIVSTGEKLEGAVAQKYKNMLWSVASKRIEMFKTDMENGVPLEEIRSHLQAFDKSLPDSYKELIGTSDFSRPSTRYMMPTHIETLGGDIQSI